MGFKHLVTFMAMSLGMTAYATAAEAEVRVSWQPGDNSANIQRAINTGDSTVIINKSDKPWLIGKPIYAKSPNQKIFFQPGVVLEAQAGAFKGKYESMVSVMADSVTLSGYGAEFKMRKADYANPNLYEKSEWRHNIHVRGARKFIIEGLTLKDSGGDGILVEHGPNEPNQLPVSKYSSGTIRGIIASDNYRQGISVVSAKDLLIENSTFQNTSGTEPASGVDLEPDHDWQKLVNVRFNNTYFKNNQLDGIKIALWHYHGSQVEDISITFDGCQSFNNGKNGIDITGIDDGYYDGPKGNIIFKNCKVESSKEHGVYIQNDQKDPTKTFNISFINTSIVNSATKSTEFYPITLFNTFEPGGIPNINFGSDFVITDNKSRPGLFASYFAQTHGLTNIHGSITVKNPLKRTSYLGNNLSNVTLKFTN